LKLEKVGTIMGYSDDNDISKPSDNFAYKDEKEKNELHDQMYSAKCSLELKFLMLMLLYADQKRLFALGGL